MKDIISLKKFQEKDLFNNISEERKQLILRVFDVEELSGVTDKSVLDFNATT